MKRTANYSLPTWEKSDFIKMDDFNALTQTLDAALKSQSDTLGEKASAASLGELQASVAALGKNLGAAGHNCRIAWGSYNGTNSAGESNPTGVTCPFYPVLVLVTPVDKTGSTNNPSIFVRPNTSGTSAPEGTIDTFLKVTWSDTGVSWYEPGGTKGYGQFNSSSYTYAYVVLGYDKTSEEA